MFAFINLLIKKQNFFFEGKKINGRQREKLWLKCKRKSLVLVAAKLVSNSSGSYRSIPQSGEVLELAGIAARNDKKTRIIPRHIQLAIRFDAKLSIS
ncbi:hypothetical protein H5410_026523 [Solanum commersonii]|uniref:Histone H2A n=1 Tax=Solanum commersonii TaxID=4109 RepID=A0A9J5YZ94_SOLCO|nr:hypothetical protein H5410_026523 [Solanum commersonii]